MDNPIYDRLVADRTDTGPITVLRPYAQHAQRETWLQRVARFFGLED